MENKIQNQNITISAVPATDYAQICVRKNRLIIGVFATLFIMIIGFFACNNSQSFQSVLAKGGVSVAESFYIPIAEASVMSENIYGDDVANSFIIFKPCTSEIGDCVTPDGVTVEDNQILTPDIFDSFYVRIYVPDGIELREVSTSSLEIRPIDCSYLSSSIMMATGEGVFTGDPDDLPDPAVSETFDFAQTISTGQSASTELDFDDLYIPYSRDLKQLVIQNPVYTGPTLGSKLFTLTVDFNDTVTGYSVYECTGDAGCDAYTVDTDCESVIDTLSCVWSPCDMNTSDACNILVDDDTTNITTIATRFTNAINDIPYSAFSASRVDNVVTLEAIEEGVHTNSYTYTAIFDNLSAQECTGLAEPLCDSTSGCDYVVENVCNGDTTADCESFQSDQPACESADISGCLWTEGGACEGEFFNCDGLEPSTCAAIPGCDPLDCSGTPNCALATTLAMCEDGLLNSCTWEGCTGTATACNTFDGDETGCNDQDGCSWDDPLCKATATLCGDISDETLCGTQDGCTWEGCTGAPMCDGFVGPDFGLCISADSCLPTTYPCDGTLSASCEDFSDTSYPTCTELGCDWVTAVCTGTPCDGLGITECIDDTDSAECTWDGITCSMSDHPEFTLECSDLGGCFADGADNAPLSITNIILTNTSSNPDYEPAHQTFNLVINFDTAITGQAVQSGDIITVKDEGLDTQATALNFAYVFNTLLGIDSPFFASTDPLNTSGITLTTRELGTHTNYYTCNVNGSPFPDSTAYCFSGGLAGVADVLVAPLTLDNSITQGDVVLVYASGSVGDNIWLSSDPSIIEVAPLNEIGDITDGSSASFLGTTLTGTEDVKVYEGTYTKGTVEHIYDDVDPYDLLETRYPITMTIPVEYDVTSPLITLVTVGGDVYDVPVDVVGNLYGNLTGSGTWSDIDGLDILLVGTLSGVVQGYASGDVQGMVHGPITVDITANASLSSGFPIANLGVGTDVPTVGTVNPSGSIEADGTFTSTITEVQEISTDIAVLYAKRPGTTILTVTDAQNCIAPLSVEVIPLEVILQMASADPSDIFDVGDDVQINAYIGTAGGDFSTMDNITSSSQIEWFSGNITVADFTANDGLLSILAPGTTNVTAHYDTNQAEIGTIESDIMPIVVDKIHGLTITLNETTQAAMPAAEKALGYQNILLAVHNPQAVGSSVTVEGHTITIVLPTGDYDNDLEKVSAIAESIASQIPIAITVTQSTTYPGVLSLLANSSDTNGIVDISSTAPVEKVTIIPNFGNNIVLPPSKTYGLMVVAEYQSGKTKRLDPGSVNWINNPLNLDDAKLLTGLLESDVYEDSTVKAEFVNADTSTAESNVLTITVHSGPVIEFVRRIGTGSILGGDTVDLQVKVTDVDTIADIAELNVLLAKSAYDTYDEIIAHPVDYFSVETYLSNVEVEEEVDGTATLVPEPSFKTYEIPVYIPQSTGLFDGDYKLLIEITDASSNVVRAVYPIYIGEVASGDVNGDSQITMIDVYFAFQIYSGAVIATPAQLEAANMDSQGGVTLTDVILLFQLVSSS
jgi:hypothetical protein